MPPPPLDEPRGPLAAPALAPAAVSPAPLTGTLPVPRRLLRRLLVLLPLVLLGVWAAVDWRTVSDGTVRLGSADPQWMLAALFFTCLTWLSAACVRQGALPERLPTGLLIASQFAAGAANHVLPASLGAHAVTLRFLRGQGVPLARATASLALYSLVRPVAKTLVLLAFLLASPGLLHLGALLPDGRTSTLVGSGALLAVVTTVVLATTVPPLRRPVLECARAALTDARVLHRRPARVLALWGGAAAAPVLQATVIFCVGAALGLPLTWAQVTFGFLAASTAVGSVPAPGGIGPVDAALVFTLSGAYGAPVELAATAVVGYRVLTVWLPLLPGALLLSVLVQRKVL
ncbi:lysylphosphatidylglycerol synthase transmembrane domain-containing protein [Streptomyces panaciradicis]|uniref:lysylphosphatidylglycerol synthase transmembrane domain-containing protein n=1 Tax=Streptomyces panaciradicis TaxID=1470261 RepID=UPI00201CCEF2|nr:lysylphosphatidylglycerol synthase transmembrane domain-containing protein [Streptomyces panaciradicis]MCL6674926.1 flippase-like domain-containing protein [Streptomyces panaciradicis]